MSKIVKTTNINSKDFSDQVLSPKLAELEKKQEEKFNIRLVELENKFNERAENKEMKTTEILAIFITLFTFISVNVSIFARVSDIYTAILFMLLMTICSIILLSFLFLIIRSKNDWKIWSGLLVALFFISLLIIVTISSDWNPKLNDIKSEVSSTKI